MKTASSLPLGCTASRRGGAARQTWNKILKFRHIYLILLPTLLYFLIFCYGPMFGAVIAFQKFSITKGILGSAFVGLANFRDFLSNYKFWQLLRNTLSINVLGLVFGFPAPIIFALLLNELRAAV